MHDFISGEPLTSYSRDQNLECYSINNRSWRYQQVADFVTMMWHVWRLVGTASRRYYTISQAKRIFRHYVSVDRPTNSIASCQIIFLNKMSSLLHDWTSTRLHTNFKHLCMQLKHITNMWGMSWIVIKDLNGECAISEQTDLRYDLQEAIRAIQFSRTTQAAVAVQLHHS